MFGSSQSSPEHLRTVFGNVRKSSENLRKSSEIGSKLSEIPSISSYPGCQRVFSLLFGAKIERRSRDRDQRFFPARHDRDFAAQFSPQTTGKKNPLASRLMYSQKFHAFDSEQDGRQVYFRHPNNKT